MKNETPYLIIIAGPTAVGKTNLAVQLAQKLGTEIISADSRQFYKELSIGVARPTQEELAVVPHHFIGHISVQQPYTVADYERETLTLLDKLFQKHQAVIITGGSGLFIDAVLKGFDEVPAINMAVREQLENDYKQYGLGYILEQLQKEDPETYKTIDKNNHRRVLRNLEICLIAGKPVSQIQTKQPKKRSFTPLKIVLNVERELLYDRINKRVDTMMAHGLLEEVQDLLPYKELNALHTVGYTELFEYLDGKHSLETAVQLIKQHTRNYAKRQLTWFRKDKDYNWFEPDALQQISSFLQQQWHA